MDHGPEITAFERLGAARLKAVIADFVDRMRGDDMIGFFFRDVDRERLVRHEFQFTARALGAKLRYEGRPIAQAHARHPIMGGQFARRKTLLGQTLQDHGVPEDIRRLLLEHTERLRPLITQQQGSHCNAGGAAGPLVTSWRPAAALSQASAASGPAGQGGEPGAAAGSETAG